MEAPDEPEEETEPAAPESTPCDRCGTYASLVDVDGRALCEACRARLLPLATRPASVAHLIGDTFALMAALSWRVPLVVIAFEVPWALAWTLWLQNESDLFGRVVGLGFGLVSGPLADTALGLLALRVVRRGELSLPEAAKLALRRLPYTFATGVVVTVALVVAAFFFIVPALFLAPAVVLATTIAGLEDVGPSEAMQRSWERTKGSRLALLIVAVGFTLLGRGADWALGAVEAVIWELPLWATLTEAQWSWASGALVFVMTLFIYQLAWLPQRLFPLTAYVKLHDASA